MASPGAAFAIILNGIILLAALVVFGLWWRAKQRSTQPEEDEVTVWLNGAVSLSREVQQVAEISDGVADRNQVERQILPLSGRIRGHVRNAPAGIDEHVLEELCP